MGTIKDSAHRSAFDKAVQGYVKALLELYDWDAFYGYWVGGDTTDVYAYGDAYFISLPDLIYIVDNDVPLAVYEEWEEYCLWASEFGLTTPNFPSWVRGCPRVSEEERDRLTQMKAQLEEEIRNYKQRY